MATDLNNIFYFAKIVEHGGLSKAGQVLGVSKSVLSDHLAKLERELGVRLLQRTTRRLQITEIGERYYQRCRVIVQELDHAAGVIDDARNVPRGKLRITCPLNLSQMILARLLTRFMTAYPEVEVVLEVTNREVASVDENCDLALRITTKFPPSCWVTRSFTLDHHLLFASPALISRYGMPKQPEDLQTLPSLGGEVPPDQGGSYVWLLTGPDGVQQSISYHPRLVAEDLLVIKDAAIAGCGIADLPAQVCQDAVTDGRLIELLPGWSLPLMKLYAIYPSSRGLTLAARTFLDYLVRRLRPLLDQHLASLSDQR